MAKELVREKGFKRVNKDELRLMIDNGKYSRGNEKLVLDIRDSMIDLALIHGYDVVVDDTNFAQTHINQIKMIAKINNAEVAVEKLDTSLKVCIERDKRRDDAVGEEVIMNMYNKYLNA